MAGDISHDRKPTYKVANTVNKTLNILYSTVDACKIADIWPDKFQNIRGRACSPQDKDGRTAGHACMGVECGGLDPPCLPYSGSGTHGT